jgi:ketosteroid isomerase-like protein
MASRPARIFLFFAAALACSAQNGAIDPAARRDIDAGNRAWIKGMKEASAAPIAAAYAEDALDCSANGDCIKGRAAVEARMKERFLQYGRAAAASVASAGAVQQGDFVFEWGRADAAYADGRKIGGRYLTVWQKQPNGEWKIFRNMAIP